MIPSRSDKFKIKLEKMYQEKIELSSRWNDSEEIQLLNNGKVVIRVEEPYEQGDGGRYYNLKSEIVISRQTMIKFIRKYMREIDNLEYED